MNQYSNIGPDESIVRYLFGAIVIVSVLHSQLHPATALIAAYAILTAMIAWEPLYTLFAYLRNRQHHHLSSARLLPQAGSKHETAHSM